MRGIHTLFVAVLLVLAGAYVDGLSLTGSAAPLAERRHQSATDQFGPELTAYFGFIDDEEAELQHLYEAGEVPKDEYVVAAARLTIMREATRKIALSRKTDTVPELYILLEDELTQLFPNGVAALKGKRVGDRVDEDWIYHGRMRNGSYFYVLERTGNLERARPY